MVHIYMGILMLVRFMFSVYICIRDGAYTHGDTYVGEVHVQCIYLYKRWCIYTWGYLCW